MYQAITTKYIGPSNVRGSRVKAMCDAGSVTLDWDNALNSEDNHIAAAKALATKLEWDGYYVGGSINGWKPGSGSGYAFVNVQHAHERENMADEEADFEYDFRV